MSVSALRKATGSPGGARRTNALVISTPVQIQTVMSGSSDSSSAIRVVEGSSMIRGTKR